MNHLKTAFKYAGKAIMWILELRGNIHRDKYKIRQ